MSEHRRDVFVGVVASLAAAISLLERTPKAKKGAPSDKMFDRMIADYKKALEAGRAAIKENTRPVKAAGDPPSLREVVTALDEFSRIKGGTPDSEGLKELIVVLMHHVGNGEGARIIQKFATICLSARTALSTSAGVDEDNLTSIIFNALADKDVVRVTDCRKIAKDIIARGLK